MNAQKHVMIGKFLRYKRTNTAVIEKESTSTTACCVLVRIYMIIYDNDNRQDLCVRWWPYLGCAWPSRYWPPAPGLPGHTAWSKPWCRCRGQSGLAWHRSSQAQPPASVTRSYYLQGSQRGLYLNTKEKTQEKNRIIRAQSQRNAIVHQQVVQQLNRNYRQGCSSSRRDR